MSNKINWDDGSFEFVDEETLKKLNTKKYSVSSCPLSFCRFCAYRQCNSCLDKAVDASQFIYDKYFDEETLDENDVVSKLGNIPSDSMVKLGLTNRELVMCCTLHLLQKIDEETMVEVDDALINRALPIILK